MTQLEIRVTRLEKNLRNYRIIFGVAIIAISTLSLMASGKKDQFVPDKVQARSFQVLDDKGNTIAGPGGDKANGSLVAYNGPGQQLANIFTPDEGAGGIHTFPAARDRSWGVSLRITNACK